MPIILSIDGNIGSGKSTIVSYLENNFETFCKNKNNNNNNSLKICFLQEPVKEWENIIDISDGKNIIQKFYSNNKAYSFQFQMMAYISRLSLFRKALEQDYDVIISERSIFTDKNVFAQMLYDCKKMSNIEFIIYLKWFDEFAVSLSDIKYIYIKTSPEICDKRIKKRLRDGENVLLEYLKECHYYHDTWLNNPEKIELGNVLVIDGNEETNTSLFIENNYFDNIMEKIYKFMIN